MPDYSNSSIWKGFLDLCKMTSVSRPNLVWDTVDWETVVSQADIHKVGPALWKSIDGVRSVPNSIKAYFHVLRDQNAERNSIISDGLVEILDQLSRAGIKTALLKGAASIADGLYEDPAERILYDVDLLVEPATAQACATTLRAIGYRDLYPRPKIQWMTPRSHHLPPLCSPSGFCVEIHTAVVQQKLEPMLPAGDVLRRARAVQWRGRTVHVLDPIDRVVHNIVHSQLHDLTLARLVELRQLRELSRLIDRYAAAIDWEEIEQRFRNAGHQQVLEEQLTYCRELLDVSSPIPTPCSERAMNKLRSEICNSTDLNRSGVNGLTDLVSNYGSWLAQNPSLLLNLLNPSFWPRKFRLFYSLLKRGRNGEAR